MNSEQEGLNPKAMRHEWYKAGGSIHGPNVETVTMPESAYFEFRRGLETRDIRVTATFRCEKDGIVGTTNAPVHSTSRHDDGSIEVVIDHWPGNAPAISPHHRYTLERSISILRSLCEKHMTEEDPYGGLSYGEEADDLQLLLEKLFPEPAPRGQVISCGGSPSPAQPDAGGDSHE